MEETKKNEMIDLVTKITAIELSV
jgi:transcriptional accessory protein Tex/SPT6